MNVDTAGAVRMQTPHGDTVLTHLQSKRDKGKNEDKVITLAFIDSQTG